MAIKAPAELAPDVPAAPEALALSDLAVNICNNPTNTANGAAIATNTVDIVDNTGANFANNGLNGANNLVIPVASGVKDFITLGGNSNLKLPALVKSFIGFCKLESEGVLLKGTSGASSQVL